MTHFVKAEIAIDKIVGVVGGGAKTMKQDELLANLISAVYLVG